jgi:hypothetical protein
VYSIMREVAGVVSVMYVTVLPQAPYTVEKYMMTSPGEKTRLRRTVLVPVEALGTKTTPSTGALRSSATALRDSSSILG